MPQETPSTPVPEPVVLPTKVGKGMLIVLFATLLVITNGVTALTMYSKYAKSPLDEDAVVDTQTTPTPIQNTVTTTPSPSVSSTPLSPTPTPRPLSFNYNYLDITFTYPSDWKIESSKTNAAGGGYVFNCKDAQVLTDFIKNTNSCTNGFMTPENLTISKSGVGEIKLWNATGLGGTCADCEQRVMTILGKQRTFTVSKTNGVVATNTGTIFEPGTKSAWKSYIVSFSTDEAHYTEIKQIIESFTYNK